MAVRDVALQQRSPARGSSAEDAAHFESLIMENAQLRARLRELLRDPLSACAIHVDTQEIERSLPRGWRDGA